MDAENRKQWHFCKMTEKSVRQVRVLYLEGTTIQELSDRFGVTYGHISNIIRGKSWARVPGAIEKSLRKVGEDQAGHKLTAKDVREIRREAARGAFRSDLARRYGVSVVTIRSVALRLAWKHIR